MQIKRMKLDKLRPAAYNPRISLKPGDPEFEKLKNSIETFGNVEPIVWNKRTGNVVGGHQRLSVLKELGETETDVSVVDLSDADEKLLNVALNKIKGDWDYDRLSELLKQFEPGASSCRDSLRRKLPFSALTRTRRVTALSKWLLLLRTTMKTLNRIARPFTTRAAVLVCTTSTARRGSSA